MISTTMQQNLMPILITLAVLASASGHAQTQSDGPQSLALPPAVEIPVDEPYPGVIRLEVDATDVDRHLFTVREFLPVAAGKTITLLYPEWLPAKHAAYGRAEHLAGLKIYGDGKRLSWTRDPIDVFAFHVSVPDDVSVLQLEFQFLSPVDAEKGRVVVTPEMMNLQWNEVVLYPAGHYARQIEVEASIQVPSDWHIATALETASVDDSVTTFRPVPLDTLIDSPVFAGRHFKQLDLDPGGDAAVRLNMFADKAYMLAITPDQLAVHRELIRQAKKLFRSHHYDHYDFLLALTSELGGVGLEHHQSSENSVDPAYFTDWDNTPYGRDLLPHEYTHSWNGKFRRPDDLWGANFNVPKRGSLLWLYEGQTQYWGYVLASRAGFLSKQQTLDALAMTAAHYNHRVGREWRPLQDTTNDPVAVQRRSLSWSSWERSEDYYSEGQLIWLDIDTLIREKSRGSKSLEDFAALFFGVNSGSFLPMTYSFKDVVRTLDEVYPFDWTTYLRARLDNYTTEAPLDGIERGGYELVYREEPSDYFVAYEANKEVTSLTYSLGFAIKADGVVSSVLWNGPAFNAGLTAGNQVIALNGFALDLAELKRVIAATKDNEATIDLLVKDAERYRTVAINYQGGLRYPHLIRNDARNALIDHILSPK